MSESPEASKPSVLRLTAVFVGSNMVSAAPRLVGGMLASWAAAPEVLGLFNSINPAVGYVPFLQLRVINGLKRDLPYHIGRGDRPHALKLAGAAQAPAGPWAMLTGGIAGFAMVMVSIWQAIEGKLCRTVEMIRDAEAAIGEVSYGHGAGEKVSVDFRKSLFIVEDVKKGETFTARNVRVIRPGQGLQPADLDAVVGRKAKSDLMKGTPLAWDMVGEQ